MQVFVITGDNKLTAEAICRKVGVFAADDDLRSKSITGVEFSKMSASDRRAFVDTTEGVCFSRAEPKHKQVGYILGTVLRATHGMLLLRVNADTAYENKELSVHWTVTQLIWLVLTGPTGICCITIATDSESQIHVARMVMVLLSNAEGGIVPQ